MDSKQFSSFLRQRRTELGMKQADLAARLHVTDKAISRWECGLGFPDIKLLEPLADALEVTLEELLRGQRREIPLPDAELEAETGRLIKEEQDLSWQRKLLLGLGNFLIVLAGTFLLRTARRHIADPITQTAVSCVTFAAVFFGGRALQFIVLRLYTHSRPWGIWHSPHTWVIFAMAMAGAWLVGNWMTLNTPDPVWNMLAFVSGICLFIAAAVYYAWHEDEINGQG